MGHTGFAEEGQGRLEDPQGCPNVGAVGPGDDVATTEVSTEELIGTIK